MPEGIGYGRKARRAVSREKARKILHDGSIRGKKLTPKQRRFFGSIVGAKDGALVTKATNGDEVAEGEPTARRQSSRSLIMEGMQEGGGVRPSPAPTAPAAAPPAPTAPGITPPFSPDPEAAAGLQAIAQAFQEAQAKGFGQEFIAALRLGHYAATKQYMDEEGLRNQVGMAFKALTGRESVNEPTQSPGQQAMSASQNIMSGMRDFATTEIPGSDAAREAVSKYGPVAAASNPVTMPFAAPLMAAGAFDALSPVGDATGTVADILVPQQLWEAVVAAIPAGGKGSNAIKKVLGGFSKGKQGAEVPGDIAQLLGPKIAGLLPQVTASRLATPVTAGPASAKQNIAEGFKEATKPAKATVKKAAKPTAKATKKAAETVSKPAPAVKEAAKKAVQKGGEEAKQAAKATKGKAKKAVKKVAGALK